MSAAHAFAGSHLTPDRRDGGHGQVMRWWCACGHEGVVLGAWPDLAAAEVAGRAEHGKHMADETPAAVTP